MIRPRPRRLLWLLAAATLMPIGVLSWMTVQLLRQDADVERQRRRDALDVAAGRVAIDIERRLQQIDARLLEGAGVRLDAAGIEPGGGAPVLFQPQSQAFEADPPELVAIEIAHEYRGELGAALAAYRRLAASEPERVRAEALLRVGRTLGKRGDTAGASATFSELVALGDVPVAGVPAALLGLYARGRILEQNGSLVTLDREGTALSERLSRGGWCIDRATFQSYADAAERWGGSPQRQVAVARTEAAIDLWFDWRDGDLGAGGRRLSTAGGADVFVVWATTPAGVMAEAIPIPELEASLHSAWSSRAVRVAARHPDGRALFGSTGTERMSLLPAETGLPFVLDVSLEPGAGTASDSSRRAMLLASLGLALVLMLAAAYGLYRTTTREVSLANEQADFVSAVSHEFRTPLTSMRHIVDLLANRGVADDARRAHYYGLLADETERLQRMVETLLSFGRIEAGGYAWQQVPVDVASLVRRTVDDFRRDPIGRRRQVTVDVSDGLPAVVGDPEALERALWNLVENAAKYSAPEAPIEVTARPDAGRVHLAVRDHGPGIEPAERTRIFQKFVRGSQSTKAGARGVGIGLALVEMIVTAHDGTVDLNSEPGRGSTFTIALPTAPGRVAAGAAGVEVESKKLEARS